MISIRLERERPRMVEKKITFHRIVSLAAFLTETLYAIGAGDRVAGVTDSCDFPDEVKEKPNVSSWFEPDLEKLIALAPDLVVGMETAHGAIRSTLESEGIQVILVNPATVEEALDVILAMGETLRETERTRVCIRHLRGRLARLDAKIKPIPFKERPTVSRVLDIEDDRIIVAGPLSFQYDVITRAGGRNISGHINEAYPKVSVERFCRWNPDVVFFCGYDRNFIPRFCANKKWRSLKAVRSGHVYQFDCALTCRAGPRMVDMAELLYRTIYGRALQQ